MTSPVRRRRSRPIMRSLGPAAALAAVLSIWTIGPAGSEPPSFVATEAMIPMHDGTRLYTQVYVPAGATEPLPIVLLRTPYGIGQFDSARVAASFAELAADGDIFALQDIRGRFRSEGQFVMLRQPSDRRDPATIDESTDAYDTIEWLLTHVSPNNGRVGLAGTSYGAWLSVMGMLDPHPALKAVVQQASPADMWNGDDVHHNGAFRLSYGFKIYELLEAHDSRGENFLVVGPWNHGGWSSGDGRKLGRIDFGSPTASEYRKTVLAPFLAHYLKGTRAFPVDEALTFRTGANEWVRHDAWPPRRGVAERRLYLREGGKLSFDPPPPATQPAFDSYLSDPANPVPYRPRPIRLGIGWSTWLVEDQRFVHRRPDVLAWVTDPLEDTLVVSGSIAAHLFASTTGTDSDWIVKLIDVYPERYPDDPDMGGYQLMIAGDVLRGRYRHSFEKPQPIVPGAVEHYTMTFPGNDHAFRRGHRIMVQVQSTWFPVIDRNPQQFVPNIFHATESDFRSATQRVFRSAPHA